MRSGGVDEPAAYAQCPFRLLPLNKNDCNQRRSQPLN